LLALSFFLETKKRRVKGNLSHPVLLHVLHSFFKTRNIHVERDTEREGKNREREMISPSLSPFSLQFTPRLAFLQTSTRAFEGAVTLVELERGGLDGGTQIFGLLAFTVHFEQSGDIESRSLLDLHLSDEDVLEGVDTLASLLDGEGDGFGESGQFLHKFSEGAVRGFLSHGINHSSSDFSDLAHLSVGGLSNLSLLLSGESNAEHSKLVAVSGSHGGVGLDEGLPLVDEGAELISGHVHAVEVGEALVPSNILDDELDLSIPLLLVAVQVSEVDVEDSALDFLRRHSGAERSVDEGSSAESVGEQSRGLDKVPILSSERVDLLLLAALLALVKSRVFADGHGLGFLVR
jgi:hypothetical protein